jgi:hypothetical protein
MKKSALFVAFLYLAHGLIQADVPAFLNYQGKVYDSSGLPIGATGTASAPVASPVNRKVVFRIYDAVTGGNRLWTEEQTVTISLGEFSVLLGQGIAATGTASAESHPPIETVFTAGSATRYLELTLDNGDNAITAADVPIAPRQQITTTAFSFRAKTADSIAGSSDLAITPLSGSSSNHGLGWYGAGRLFGGVAVDGPVLYGNAGGALGSNSNGSYNTALRWNGAGQVGVGTATLAGAAASSKLVLQGNDSATPAQQLVIRGESDTSKRLNIGFNTTANQATLQSYTAASTVGNLLLNPSGGNVGIGVVGPNEKLEIAGNVRVNAGGLSLYNSSGNGATRDMQTGLLSNEIHGNSGPGTDAGHLRLSAGGQTSVANKTAIDLYGYDTNDMRFFTNGTERMRVASGGNVGIGISNPAYKLDVNGMARVAGDFTANGAMLMRKDQTIYGQNSANGYEAVFWPRASDGTYINYGTDGFYIRNNAGVKRMTMADNGVVRIGDAPSDALLNVGLAPAVTSFTAYGKLTTGGATGTNVGRSVQISIHTSGHILAPEFDVDSDIRIKTALHATDPIKDLETLMGIQVTDYRFKDTVANGNAPQKKVIAQQVETVYPQAVKLHKGVVPDIYKNAAVKDGWVMLATDLKAGERVRLVSPGGESVEEVLEVRSDAFRTRLKTEEEETFVYGREVSDFHSVDYDAIAMLNVSATQEIKREKDAEIQALRAENAELRERLDLLRTTTAELTERDAIRETRLLSIERRLGGEKPASETVSIKSENLAR